MAKAIKPIERGKKTIKVPMASTPLIPNLNIQTQGLSEKINSINSIENDLSVKSEEYNTAITGKKVQKKNAITLKLSIENRDRVDKLFYKLLLDTENHLFRFKNSFFRIIIQEMIEELQSKKVYVSSPESTPAIRKGKRVINGLPKELITVTFSPFNDDTVELFHNLCHSLMLQDGMQNIKYYSRSFFFLQVLDFIEKNYKGIVKKYKYFK